MAFQGNIKVSVTVYAVVDFKKISQAFIDHI